MPFFLNNEYTPVTALFDEEGNQIFETVGILSLAASPSNKFAEHTLEDGTVISDNKTRLQDRVSIQAILSPDDFEAVYQKLKEADRNDVKFTVQTRVDSYDNMYLESYPYEESSRIVGTIALNINFVEQQFVGVKTGTLPESKVKNPADTDTVDSGAKLPQNDASSLKKIIDSFFG